MTLAQLCVQPRIVPGMEGFSLTSTSMQGSLVLAADTSDPESYPVRFAKALARRQHAPLVLLPLFDPACTGSDRDHALETIQASLRNGSPSMVLLGTRHAAGRASLGALARKLILHGSAPVLVIGPPEARQLAEAGRWRRVLAATDFSAAATTALLFAHRIAGDELLAFHCASERSPERAGQMVERLRFLAPFNESHTLPVQHIVQTGDPGVAIRVIAEKIRPDLIVLGSPSAELADAELIGSTVCEVIRHAQCPVLLIPRTPPHEGRSSTLKQAYV